MWDTFRVWSFEFSLGNSVHFARYTMLRFSKDHCSHGFHPISIKLCEKHGNQGGYRLSPFLAIRQKFKILWYFDFFVKTGAYGPGLEISKHYSCSFQPLSINLHEYIGYHGGKQAIVYLGNRASFLNFVALWNFNMGVNGKSMWHCNILKTTGRRAKSMKI